MELRTRLSQDRFSWLDSRLTAAHRAHVLVEVEAPALPTRTEGTATHLVVVLDRSGSMGGDRIHAAHEALCSVVDRLSPTDTFGLVTFDSQVEVPVPAGPVRDRDAIKRAIRGVHPRGSTDLAGGLIRGLKEARRLEATAGVRVLLISDGHANSGVTDPEVLRQYAERYVEHGVTTSSLGIGLGYDERILSAVALGGGGEEHFAQEADTAAQLIGEECGDLLSQRFLSCRLTITPANGMARMEMLNQATCRQVGDDLQVELGGLHPQDLRTLVLRLDPKRATRPGRRKVAALRLDYVLADDLSEHTVTHTVWAHVARDGERPAVVDRDVMAEVLMQRVQRRIRRATDALAVGNADEARERFDATRRLIERHWNDVPLERRDEFRVQLERIAEAAHHAFVVGDAAGVAFAAKSMTVHAAMMSRPTSRKRRS